MPWVDALAVMKCSDMGPGAGRDDAAVLLVTQPLLVTHTLQRHVSGPAELLSHMMLHATAEACSEPCHIASLAALTAAFTIAQGHWARTAAVSGGSCEPKATAHADHPTSLLAQGWESVMSQPRHMSDTPLRQQDQ